MVFKLLFLLSLVLGSVFLDAIGLVDYEDEISSLDKLEWGFAKRILFFIRKKSPWLKFILYVYLIFINAWYSVLVFLLTIVTSLNCIVTEKPPWGVVNKVLYCIIYRSKYLKWRIKYSYGLNPSVITNKETHMIYGNMNKEAGSSQDTGLVKKKRSKISQTFFPKLNSTLLNVSLGFWCFI